MKYLFITLFITSISNNIFAQKIQKLKVEAFRYAEKSLSPEKTAMFLIDSLSTTSLEHEKGVFILPESADKNKSLMICLNSFVLFYKLADLPTFTSNDTIKLQIGIDPKGYIPQGSRKLVKKGIVPKNSYAFDKTYISLKEIGARVSLTYTVENLKQFLKENKKQKKVILKRLAK